jgi:hypothetical protein
MGPWQLFPTIVYLPRDQADRFVKAFVTFAHGKVVSDEKHADAGEIGRPGLIYRRIRIASVFGEMLVLVTDGHLSYPLRPRNHWI